MLTIQQILKNSDDIRALKAHIKTTYDARKVSKEHWALWERACETFHQQFDALSYPGGDEAYLGIARNEPLAVEAAVRFLLADPYHFRSGYVKEYLWRHISHCTLSASAKNRLEMAAFSYLDRRICREFWAMCKAMARIGRSAFWIEVATRTQNEEPEAKRALCLLSYRADVHAGSRVRRAMHRDWIGKVPRCLR